MEGANVVIADIRLDLAKATVQALEASGTHAIAVKTDVRKSRQVKAMVAEALHTFGKLDVLVNNAGVVGVPKDTVHVARPWEVEEVHWDATFDVNIKGTYLCCKHVIPHMITQQSGKIVNIASGAALAGSRFIAHYAASKAAIVNYTQSLALCLGEYGITANTILPNLVWTDMWKKGVQVGAETFYPEFQARPRSFFDQQVERTWIKRATTPENIGSLAVFLASRDADDITGQWILVGR
jgi:3-oxoacyl-[acyl-carrier protein] reductase